MSSLGWRCLADLPCEETHTADESLTIGVGGAVILRPERGHLAILTGVA